MTLFTFASGAIADEVYKITSANLDTSNCLIVFTAQDSTENPIMEEVKLVNLENPKRSYFDIDSAILTFPKQDWTFNSGCIKQIKISQFSVNPNKVRVVMYFDDDFKTDSIKFMRVKNNIILKFKNEILNNEYFQNTYRDEHSSSSDFYEYLTITTPTQVTITPENIVGQIQEAFGNAMTQTMMSKKELKLNTKYYLQNITPKQDSVLINGFGALTIERPLILTNPSRIVYDLSNTLVDMKIRNKEFKINETDSVKIGQFSVNKARIVITTENVNDYIPIFSNDNQSLLLANYKKINHTNLADNISDAISYDKEKIDDQTSTMSLCFNAPIVHGIDRTNSELVVYLYNVAKYNEDNFKSTYANTPFSNAKISLLPKVGLKLSIPLEQDSLVSTYMGADSKVLKVKVQVPKKSKIPVLTPSIPGAGMPSIKKTILIDPGHGGSDCGAIRDNTNEKDINLDVANRVKDELINKGYDVMMTRHNDIFVSLPDRVALAAKTNADVFVSIHVNSSVKPEITGVETHYYRQESMSLAQSVHSSLASAVQSPNRGLFKSKFYVINHTTMPAILVEIGFLSNDAERLQLISEKRKQATAKAIAEGVQNYFKQCR